MKTTPSEVVSTKALLTRTLHDFLQTQMYIPPPISSQVVVCNISHHQDMESSKLIVELSNSDHVKTIFKYVRNLALYQQVSPFIPPVLGEKYSALRSQAYHIRNGRIRHKTVIKYCGLSLALYARPTNSNTWQLVPETIVEPALEPMMRTNMEHGYLN